MTNRPRLRHLNADMNAFAHELALMAKLPVERIFWFRPTKESDPCRRPTANAPMKSPPSAAS